MALCLLVVTSVFSAKREGDSSRALIFTVPAVPTLLIASYEVFYEFIIITIVMIVIIKAVVVTIILTHS